MVCPIGLMKIKCLEPVVGRSGPSCSLVFVIIFSRHQFRIPFSVQIQTAGTGFIILIENTVKQIGNLWDLKDLIVQFRLDMATSTASFDTPVKLDGSKALFRQIITLILTAIGRLAVANKPSP